MKVWWDTSDYDGLMCYGIGVYFRTRKMRSPRCIGIEISYGKKFLDIELRRAEEK